MNNTTISSPITINNSMNDPSIIVESNPNAGTMTRTTKFTKPEDVQLCNSFLAVSYDPIRGTDQSAQKLWERIHQDYENRIADNLKGIRSVANLSTRWSNIINPRCAYFAGILTQVRDAPHSGTNAADHVSFALSFN
jgi:hypothetical protein